MQDPFDLGAGQQFGSSPPNAANAFANVAAGAYGDAEREPDQRNDYADRARMDAAKAAAGAAQTTRGGRCARKKWTHVDHKFWRIQRNRTAEEQAQGVLKALKIQQNMKKPRKMNLPGLFVTGS